MQNRQGLELRMYFFVPYNISPIQQAIQAGHAMGEYALKYGRRNPDHIIWDFLSYYKTWMVFNGGTTNSSYDFEGVPEGDLNKIHLAFKDSGIEFSDFYEPDLNNALTAVCFIADARVFDKENYPDFEKIFNPARAKELIRNNEYNLHLSDEEFDARYDPTIEYNKYYEQWFNNVGGKDVVFMRDILKGKRFT